MATVELALNAASKRQEFPDEAAGSRQSDIGQREHHERQGIERHAVDEAAIGRDLARMEPVIDDPDAQEERARNEPVRDHLEQRAVDALPGHREDADRHEAHMGDG